VLSYKALAEVVVGSTPTRSIFINLVNYGIELDLIWEGVGQKPSAVCYLPIENNQKMLAQLSA